jgi:inosine-uridine nucleoside N-ribohydrolase
MKLIIDTDPGIDDAIAIALAHALPQVDLIGMTAVFGNTQVIQSSRNARYLADLIGFDVPVAEGAALPYGADSYAPSDYVHGPEGLGDFMTIPQIGQNDPRNAAQFLCEMAAKHARELVICAIGPLANIADAIALDPSFVTNVKSLVIMGGAFNHAGNVSKYAEANIIHDPIAADAVFGSGMTITMVGLDATMLTLLTPDDFDDLAVAAPNIGGFMKKICDFYLKFYRSVGVMNGCPMHDALAVLACTDPDKFTFEMTGIKVIQSGDKIGATVADPTRKPTAVAIGCDATWAVNIMKTQISGLG